LRTWLKLIRENSKLNQYSVAHEARISQQFYSFIENGKRDPSVKVAKRIAEVLDFDWTRFYEKEKTEKGAKSMANSINLENVPTYCLVDELERREAVKKIPVAAYEEYQIKIGDEPISDIPESGPAIVLVIWD